MALDAAWEVLKGIRTSAHPTGGSVDPRQTKVDQTRIAGSLQDLQQSRKDPRFPWNAPDYLTGTGPNAFCNQCREIVAPGQKCFCQRRIQSKGTKIGGRHPNRPTSVQNTGGFKRYPITSAMTDDEVREQLLGTQVQGPAASTTDADEWAREAEELQRRQQQGIW